MTDSFLDYELSADEAAGKKALPPVGPYNNVLIDNIEEFPVDVEGKYYKPGQVCDLKVTLVCSDSDVDLSRYITVKLPLHPKSAYYGMLEACVSEGLKKALEGEELVAKIKGMKARDLIGCRVNIYITHDAKPQGDGKFANYNWMPFLAKK
jgi:hypothetical protein